MNDSGQDLYKYDQRIHSHSFKARLPSGRYRGPPFSRRARSFLVRYRLPVIEIWNHQPMARLKGIKEARLSI